MTKDRGCNLKILELSQAYDRERDLVSRPKSEGTAVAFSSNGRYLAFGSYGGIVRVLVTETWAEAFEPLKTRPGALNCLQFSADAQHLVASGDGSLFLWNMKDGRKVGELCEAIHSMSSIVFSPSGQHIAGASDHGVIGFWKVNLIGAIKGDVVHSEVKVEKFAVSGDGKQVLVLTEDHKFIVRKTLDGSQINRFWEYK